MKYDIYANKSCLYDIALDTRIRLLAKGIWKESKDKSELDDYKEYIKSYEELIDERLGLMSSMNIYPPKFDKSVLIPGSWALVFTFELARPYISKDDNIFYVRDNPLKKEKIFKIPYVSGSTWKGVLRSTIRLSQGWDDSQEEIIQLFGNPRGDESNHHSGSLNFFPTFFTDISLEVVNPHSRKKGKGLRPIYFECAPQGASGTFVLLNYPIYGKQSPAIESLRIVARGIEILFLDLGFGAKTLAGFGVAKDKLPKKKCARVLLVSDKGVGTGTTMEEGFNSISELNSVIQRLSQALEGR